jgi:hypothetical protein
MAVQLQYPFKIERDNGNVFIRLINPGLKEILRRYLQIEKLYERNPKVV